MSSSMTPSYVDYSPVYLTLNTISPPKVVTQLSKPNKDLLEGEESVAEGEGREMGGNRIGPWSPESAGRSRVVKK
jgi:hypothetical protein